MNVIIECLNVTWQTFKAMLTALLSLFPIYQQLSSFREQLIAAALGIPVVVLSAITITVTVTKFLLKRI